MKIIAIDPGRTTGYCYARISEQHLYYYPFQAMDDVDDLWNRLERFAPNFIVIEDFEYRSGRARPNIVLFSVELIGITRFYSLRAPHVGLYVQKAAQGKSYYTDATLKAQGLYQRGIPHGMDASRHLLQWATFGAGYQYFQGVKGNFATMLDEWEVSQA